MYSSYAMVYDIDHRPCFMMLAYEIEYSSSGNDMTYILVYSSYSIYNATLGLVVFYMN